MIVFFTIVRACNPFNKIYMYTNILLKDLPWWKFIWLLFMNWPIENSRRYQKQTRKLRNYNDSAVISFNRLVIENKENNDRMLLNFHFNLQNKLKTTCIQFRIASIFYKHSTHWTNIAIKIMTKNIMKKSINLFSY